MLAVVVALGLSAQETAQPAPVSSASPSGLTKAISPGYDTILLGMAYQAAYDALVGSTALDYRGTPDVSMSPDREEKIIETRGGRYISRGVFQFRDDKLFTIILELNPLQMDYYTLFTSFSARYGEPFSLDPKQTVWEDSTVRLILEKPCTVKYIDKPVIEALIQESTINASRQELSRQAFIDKL
jgi:hypothetical protein